jgi:hypothetical protein
LKFDPAPVDGVPHNFSGPSFVPGVIHGHDELTQRQRLRLLIEFHGTRLGHGPCGCYGVFTLWHLNRCPFTLGHQNKILNPGFLNMLNPVEISCIASNWRGVVARTLGEIHEIDLIHFLFSADIEFCEDMASKYSMDFRASPGKRVAFFRKRTSSAPSK